MLRLAPRLMAVLLSAAALAGCASIDRNAAAAPTGKNNAVADNKLPTDMEGGIRQAQMLRNAGQYDEAIRIASQLMLVNGDDPRVAAEYGKALTQKGRAQDAVEFLNRAIELAPGDWTLYSALGVSFDQLGNQNAARTAYDHALMLKANEPSVLNNYALSRMLAGDTEGAKTMMARAQAAGGASDAKIAANIALVNKLVAKADVSASKPAAQAQNIQPSTEKQQTVAAPTPVAATALPPANADVVMQPVPADPLAGPVKPATHKPTSIAPAKSDADSKTSDAQAPAEVKPASPAAKTKTADATQVPALRLTADARNP